MVVVMLSGLWVVESETHCWNVRPRRGVLEHATMAGGKDEAVAVEPVWVLGVVPHDLVVQDVTHRSAPHGQTRSVTRVGLLHGIHPQESDHVHGLFHKTECKRIAEKLSVLDKMKEFTRTLYLYREELSHTLNKKN